MVRSALALVLAGLIAAAAPLRPARADEPPPPATPDAGAPGAEPKPQPAQPKAPAPASIPRRLGHELYSDFKWSVNSLEADGEDIVKSPLHVGDLLRTPSFYWTTLASGAALGAGFGLDEPARRTFRKISKQDADHLESWGNLALWSGTGALYLYGLAVDEPRAREYALTGMLSTGISGLLTSALKVTFGRERPKQDNGHWRWFKGGRSFVSGAATPAFALAATLSEYGDNRWYVALPAYTAAGAVGLGRMGKDAHWISDIIGSALLGVGTTELFLHLHALHEADPSRYRVFPVVVRGGAGLGVAVVF